jgi:transposase
LEAGPLSQWLYMAMKQAGLAVELLETRHVRDAFKAMPVKSDRNDARGIAQLMRLGWFRPVHCKSMAAQEVRAILTARKLVQSKLLDVENSLRGILRGFGLKVGKTTRKNFAERIKELVKGHPNLKTIGEALLSVRAVLLGEFHTFEKRVRAMSCLNANARLLMSTPGASVEASGPHDFTVRVRRIRRVHRSRPPHPAPNVRDDREAPLFSRTERCGFCR